MMLNFMRKHSTNQRSSLCNGSCVESNITIIIVTKNKIIATVIRIK